MKTQGFSLKDLTVHQTIVLQDILKQQSCIKNLKEDTRRMHIIFVWGRFSKVKGKILNDQ